MRVTPAIRPRLEDFGVMKTSLWRRAVPATTCRRDRWSHVVHRDPSNSTLCGFMKKRKAHPAAAPKCTMGEVVFLRRRALFLPGSFFASDRYARRSSFPRPLDRQVQPAPGREVHCRYFCQLKSRRGPWWGMLLTHIATSRLNAASTATRPLLPIAFPAANRYPLCREMLYAAVANVPFGLA